MVLLDAPVSLHQLKRASVEAFGGVINRAWLTVDKEVHLHHELMQTISLEREVAVKRESVLRWHPVDQTPLWNHCIREPLQALHKEVLQLWNLQPKSYPPTAHALDTGLLSNLSNLSGAVKPDFFRCNEATVHKHVDEVLKHLQRLLPGTFISWEKKWEDWRTDVTLESSKATLIVEVKRHLTPEIKHLKQLLSYCRTCCQMRDQPFVLGCLAVGH